MKIITNILLILKESYVWRNRELLVPATGFIEPKLNLINFIKNNSILFLLAILLSSLLYPYINEGFAGYLINSLAIFVGLFTSVLILVFDKYLNQKKEFENRRSINSNLSTDQKKLQNFSRQFVFIALEALLIAVSLIAFLLLPLVFKQNYLVNIVHYDFVELRCWNWSTLKIFFKNSLFFLSRAIIIFLLFKFIKYLFFIFGSLGSFLKGVFDNHVRL